MTQEYEQGKTWVYDKASCHYALESLKKSCLQTNEVQQFYWDLSATSLQQLSRYLSRTLLNDHCGEPDALIVTNDYLRLVDCSCLHAHSNDNNNKNNRHPCSAASFHKCSWVNPHLWTGRLRARCASPPSNSNSNSFLVPGSLVAGSFLPWALSRGAAKSNAAAKNTDTAGKTNNDGV